MCVIVTSVVLCDQKRRCRAFISAARRSSLNCRPVNPGRSSLFDSSLVPVAKNKSVGALHRRHTSVSKKSSESTASDAVLRCLPISASVLSCSHNVKSTVLSDVTVSPVRTVDAYWGICFPVDFLRFLFAKMRSPGNGCSR